MSWLHTVIDVPAEDWSDTSSFWASVLGWPVGAGWPGHPELRSFEPPEADAYVHLQTIEGTPRVHLDLEVGDVAATRDRAVILGASIAAPEDRWQAMLSPGGLSFCLFREQARTAPQPVRMPQGQRTRLVCRDTWPWERRSSGRVGAGFRCATRRAWPTASPRTHRNKCATAISGEVGPAAGSSSHRAGTLATWLKSTTTVR